MRHNPDELKLLSDVLLPDPRKYEGDDINPALRSASPGPISDHYDSIAEVGLSASIPDAIRIHFETCRNLYLYGWFVYRFLPVAEHQALVCLEFALRVKFGVATARRKHRSRSPATLRPLLKYAIDVGAIRNEHFSAWHKRALLRARHRYDMEKVREMVDRGLDRLECDPSEATVREEDRDWDYLSVLLDSLSDTRNEYAHGSGMLYPSVLGTIRIVSEVINALFAATEDAATS